MFAHFCLCSSNTSLLHIKAWYCIFCRGKQGLAYVVWGGSQKSILCPNLQMWFHCVKDSVQFSTFCFPCWNIFPASIFLKWCLSFPQFKFLRQPPLWFPSLCPLSRSAGLLYLPPLSELPAVFLNTGICVSAAGLVDQLDRRGGSHSKATCSVSIEALLGFKSPGCESASLIKPHWDRRKPPQLMLMRSALSSLSRRVVCVQKDSELRWFSTAHCTRIVPQN